MSGTLADVDHHAPTNGVQLLYEQGCNRSELRFHVSPGVFIAA